MKGSFRDGNKVKMIYLESLDEME